ncbi:hypothetical protein D1872_201400 [compost metagenome]
MLEIVYAENIIVGVVKDNQFTWYILDKDDLYDVLYDQLDYVAMSNLIEEHKTTVEYLRTCMLKEHYRCADDTLKFNPSVYINFDTMCLFSLYPEYTAFERMVYENWKGKFFDFMDIIPEEEKYWIVNGKNYIEDTFNYFVKKGIRAEWDVQ